MNRMFIVRNTNKYKLAQSAVRSPNVNRQTQEWPPPASRALQYVYLSVAITVYKMYIQ